VAIEHRNAVNFIHWAVDEFTPAELSNVLFSTSICFDLSVFEMFVTLASGGRVIVARNVLELLELPQKDEITLINSVPSAVAELLQAGGIPASVQTVNLAGEPLKPALVDRLYSLGTIVRVNDLYGPSETTTYSTWTVRRPRERANIGRPIANTRIYLLDANLEVVPIGVAGEMYIGGHGVARGYLNQPDLTAARFINDPHCYYVGHGHECGARLYRTGDRARWLPDGRLELFGRLDDQVKIRGHRIELGEIESTLAQHPMVRECVVMAREDLPGNRRLVAYVVTGEEPAGTLRGELRAFLQNKLPEHAVPSALEFIGKLPRTTNGKINRRELPAPQQQIADSVGGATAPATPVEESLVGIWREVLQVSSVGVHDNFFELGGNSLLMIRVISRIRATMPIELPVRRFFEAPTIAALAEVIEETLIEQINDLSDEEARQFAQSTS
jgi:acyl-coenzyme A synthetase/AMP-(fatty) acid ligase